ncbi:hypothetical protein TIFTF001_017628 [Ficus carica]|uniref:Uncharacterized protein n=1 Tax=Ficus carica TaxID=3494 RepID=A0AA88A8D0_FICCA|nr:hypothetical protein TIFTF001_017628 [Ficus carica]
MWWPAMLDQNGQVSKARGLLIKARNMRCPFLVVASHMWKMVLALASQVSKAKGLLIKARSMRCLFLMVVGHR